MGLTEKQNTTKEKLIKTLLQNGGKSFYDYCLEHNKFDILLRWDFELNGCSPQDITYRSKGFNGKGYWFKCPRGIHPSELHSIDVFARNGKNITCKMCTSFAQWGIDNICSDFLEKYWDYKENDKLGLNPWQIRYGCNKHIYIYCQEYSYHGSYFISCNNFSRGRRCGYCNVQSGRVHLLDSLGKLLEDMNLLWIWSNKNKKSSYEYSIHSTKRAWFKCINKKHKDEYRIIGDVTRCDFRCYQCMQEKSESFLQEKVRLYLESLNMGEILHEHQCTITPKNPKTNNILPFDNEIKELKLICEVHGSQHYEINGWHILASKKNGTTPEYEFHKRQLYDRYKKFIAYKRGYKYLEIPYWTNNGNEDWKILINNKLNKILKKKIEDNKLNNIHINLKEVI